MRSAGPVALVGSGEYLPVMDEVDRQLLEGRPPLMVQLATAAVPDGPERVAYWHDLGRASADRLGVEQVVLEVEDRNSANDSALADMVAGAGLIYLSGGKPTFLAKTLRDTKVWSAIESAWHDGAALAGCSAGAMALTSYVPDLRHPLRDPVAGLDVVPELRVIPHFDRFAAWISEGVLRRYLSVPPGVSVVGIDEDTALMSGENAWQVLGRQSAWLLSDGDRREFPAGAVLALSDLDQAV